MDIRLVAVDMDGTFLRQKPIYDEQGDLIDVIMDYDKEQFEIVFNRLKANNGHFVVASGNQYYQLKSFFPNLDNEVTYVAENGAFIVEKGKELFSVEIDKSVINKMLDAVNQFDNIKICVCGKASAYVLKGDEKYRDFMNKFYHNLQEVNDFNEINDQILKFALTVPNENMNIILKSLKQAFVGILDVVDSGHNCIDLIVPNNNKGTAIERLCKRWGLTAEQCVAFGDGGNDYEMIKFVKYGYAMENAKDSIKEVAYSICETNNEQGVLKTLMKIL